MFHPAKRAKRHRRPCEMPRLTYQHGQSGQDDAAGAADRVLWRIASQQKRHRRIPPNKCPELPACDLDACLGVGLVMRPCESALGPLRACQVRLVFGFHCVGGAVANTHMDVKE